MWKIYCQLSTDQTMFTFDTVKAHKLFTVSSNKLTSVGLNNHSNDQNKANNNHRLFGVTSDTDQLLVKCQMLCSTSYQKQTAKNSFETLNVSYWMPITQ